MAVIEGNEAWPYYQAGTTSLEYLTDNLNGYAVDYWFPHASDGLTPVNGLTETVGKNLPVETVTYPILSPADIQHIYLHDYYFRIHIIPATITLGNVLTEQNLIVEVWNTYFQVNPLASVITSNGDGISFTNAEGLNSYFPLEWRLYNLKVLPVGDAIINASIVMNFSTGAVTLPVTGQRAILWSFPPLMDFNETIEWKTDVINTIANENTYSLRDVPRASFSYNYIFRTLPEFSLAKNLAKTFQHLSLATPIWSQIKKVNPVSAGSSVINLSTANIEFNSGDIAVIFKTYDYYEILEILSMTSTQVNLKQPLVNEFTGDCWFLPVKICLMPKGIDFTRKNSSRNSARINFKSTKGYVLPEVSSMDSYLGLPVITLPSVVTSGISERFERNVEYIDQELGGIISIDLENYTRHRQMVSITAHGQDNIYKLKRFLDFTKGKYNNFFLPTFSNDCIPVTTTLIVGSTFITVIASKLSIAPPKYVKIIGDTSAYTSVLSITDNGGTEVITFTSGLSSGITNVKQVQIMTKVRFDTDTFEIAYEYTKLKNITAKFSAPVLEVP